MEDTMIATHLENLDRRLSRVEQILPTLATKDDLLTLATKEELRATATELRQEIRDEGERARRHMNILNEALRGDVQLIAEHLASRTSKPQD